MKEKLQAVWNKVVENKDLAIKIGGAVAGALLGAVIAGVIASAQEDQQDNYSLLEDDLVEDESQE